MKSCYNVFLLHASHGVMCKTGLELNVLFYFLAPNFLYFRCIRFVSFSLLARPPEEAVWVLQDQYRVVGDQIGDSGFK